MLKSLVVPVLFLLLCLPTRAQADDGWFLPNPRKARIPYSGSPAEAREVRKVLEATIPELKVLPDKTGHAILFEGAPTTLQNLERVLQAKWLRPGWETVRKP